MILLTKLPSAPHGQWSQAACSTGRFAATPVADVLCWAEAVAADSKLAPPIKAANSNNVIGRVTVLRVTMSAS